MEKRKIQRIVGILVVISLVIVVLPLLFGENSTPLQAKTLPVPEMNNNPVEQTFNPQDFDLPLAVDNPLFAENNDSTKLVSDNTAVMSDANNQAQPSVPAQVQQPTSLPLSNQQNTLPTNNDQNMATQAAPIQAGTPNTEPAKIPQPSSLNNKTRAMPTTMAAMDNTTQPQPKKKHHHQTWGASNTHGWVVQMGSFKSKTNAMRLTDKLRGAGFKAFTYEVKGSNGLRTRVFIGPESNRTLAEAVSNRVNKRLNMRGYIVAYKPA